jgi:hypothetical protein
MLDEKDLKQIARVLRCWAENPNLSFKEFLKKTGLSKREWEELAPKVDAFVEMLDEEA